MSGEAEIRFLIGEVLTRHAARVERADHDVEQAARAVERSKESYDRLGRPDPLKSKALGQAEHWQRHVQALRDDLDSEPAACLANAVLALLERGQ